MLYKKTKIAFALVFIVSAIHQIILISNPNMDELTEIYLLVLDCVMVVIGLSIGYFENKKYKSYKDRKMDISLKDIIFFLGIVLGFVGEGFLSKSSNITAIILWVSILLLIISMAMFFKTKERGPNEYGKHWEPGTTK